MQIARDRTKLLPTHEFGFRAQHGPVTLPYVQKINLRSYLLDRHLKSNTEKNCSLNAKYLKHTWRKCSWTYSLPAIYSGSANISGKDNHQYLCRWHSHSMFLQEINIPWRARSTRGNWRRTMENKKEPLSFTLKRDTCPTIHLNGTIVSQITEYK